MRELERSKGVKEVSMYNYKEPMINNSKDFAETFKDFCFASLVFLFIFYLFFSLLNKKLLKLYKR